MFLDDSDAHPRVKERMDLTEQTIAANAVASFRLETRGETTIERVISLVLLGDLVSIYLAALRGVDPGPVKVDRRPEGRAGTALSGAGRSSGAVRGVPEAVIPSRRRPRSAATGSGPATLGPFP